MADPRPIVIDFETEAIQRRPEYPPKPVGFSMKKPGERKSKYYSWGHPTENNCTKRDAQRVLAGAFHGREPLLFHHAKFDVDVAVTHMDVRLPTWNRIHDTLYLLFLHDPYATSLSLKPSAERILKMKSSERDMVKEWILANVLQARRKPSEWGAYICRAPGKLVGEYADGDVVRTEKLFVKLYREICKRDMLAAYDRERRLMPILMENERHGIRVDLAGLEDCQRVYSKAMETADQWLRKRLKVKDLNLDADSDVADALFESGVVTGFKLTAKGNRSVSKKNLTPDMFGDSKVASVYGYRNILSTCLGTFIDNWIDTARANSEQKIFTTWNQVRQTHGNDNNVGARTGRMSSTPPFMNIPKNWKKAKSDGYVYPAFLKVPDLPILRKFWLPDSPKQIWCRRDYNQQELRLLAHFEDGTLMRQYNENPRLDVHQIVQDGFLEIANITMDRDPVKIMNFGEIYGMGLGEMALRMRIEVSMASKLKKAKRELLPDLKELEESIKHRGKAGLAITTWGGREYFTEPAKFVKKHNRVMSFEYKLLNYLIQGSAADVTKESLIRYHDHPKSGPNTGDARFLLMVHDENDISAEQKKYKQEMLLLRDVMQSVEVDVPMLSDGEVGPNWGSLTALKEN